MGRRRSGRYSWPLGLLLRGGRGAVCCEFVHELEAELEDRAFGVNLDLIESLGVGNDDIDQPPCQTHTRMATLTNYTRT